MGEAGMRKQTVSVTGEEMRYIRQATHCSPQELFVGNMGRASKEEYGDRK